MAVYAVAGRGLVGALSYAAGSDVARLEAQLDSFDPRLRLTALLELSDLVQSASISLAPPGGGVNLHAHTFFSFNGYGFSPSHFAWAARQAGLAVAGITDFDVLDGLEEFHNAGRLLNLKTCVSLETRVRVPEFGLRVINSPGEPGIAYHMGVGFPAASSHPYLATTREASARRTRQLTERVNRVLSPVEVDFDADIVPLTPQGNVTERHVCEALCRKAEVRFPDPLERRAFWIEKLGAAPSDANDLKDLIRAKTMKLGGAGYVMPEPASFPSMAEMNDFVRAAGAIPTLAWLNGLSEGEEAIEEYLDTAMTCGTAALNIIPDRNYKPKIRDLKLKKLEEIVALAVERGLPVIVGTEMNAPGQKFVDDFEAEELKPLLPVFRQGAFIAYAHTALQRSAGLGYLSRWAEEHFPGALSRNAFFAELGEAIQPETETRLTGLGPDAAPKDILKRFAFPRK